MKDIKTYNNKNILVLGLGKSGFAVSELLLQLGANLTLNDKADLEKNAKAQELKSRGVRVIGGHHPVDLLEKEHFDYLVKNPGIPYENPMVQKAEELNIPIITEPEVALSCSDAPYVCVTGSNGKTTTVMLTQRILDHHLQKSGHHAYAVGNIGVPISEVVPKATKDDILVVEISSFQLLGVTDIDPKVAAIVDIYNNVHLDYHKTFENYLKAKKAFFDNLPAYAFAITNADDKNGNVMLQNTVAKKYTYSIRGNADFKARILECHFEGMLLEINRKEVTVRFTGKFNASNLIAVYGAACLLGLAEDDVLLILSTLVPVTGRFNALRSKRGYTAIVDYAHTPDALINVLNAIHEVLDKKGKVITVIGAGGNRDKGKRPLMAHAAAQLSDKIIITSDNPRFEDPQDIINDMLEGLNEEDRKKTLCNPDRREAIKTACMIAEKNDVVLIAGKGHENYQEIKGVKHHFDDKEEIEHIFENE